MTPERRAALEARRAELRAKREARAALDRCLRYAHRAKYGREAEAEIRAEIEVLRAMGR